MQKIYFILFRFVVVAAALAGLSSCIRDDLDGCADPRGNLRLTVKLDAGNAGRSGNAESYRIDRADLYVFDGNNRFLKHARGGAYNEGEEYEFFLDLEAGKYHFVVWTNEGDVYKINRTLQDDDPDAPAFDELQLYMDHASSGCLLSGIPDLLHGIYTDAVVYTNRNNHFTVYLSPLTYNINIKVKGMPVSGDGFDFSITDNNSHYNFDHSIVPGRDDFQHTRTCSIADGELNTSFKVLTLQRDRTPQFVFRNTASGEILFDKCLIEMICDAYEKSGQQVDFSQTHTFDIVLSYDTDMGVTVSVNGWDYKPEHSDLE